SRRCAIATFDSLPGVNRAQRLRRKQDLSLWSVGSESFRLLMIFSSNQERTVSQVRSSRQRPRQRPHPTRRHRARDLRACMSRSSSSAYAGRRSRHILIMGFALVMRLEEQTRDRDNAPGHHLQLAVLERAILEAELRSVMGLAHDLLHQKRIVEALSRYF